MLVFEIGWQFQSHGFWDRKYVKYIVQIQATTDKSPLEILSTQVIYNLKDESSKDYPITETFENIDEHKPSDHSYSKNKNSSKDKFGWDDYTAKFFSASNTR